ncbi:MAG: hypothetical protein ACK46Y_04585 [Fluviicola sp.]
MTNTYYEIPKKEKKSKFMQLIVFIVIVTVGIGVFAGVRGCMADLSPDVVNLAVKKGGKTYVYSNMGKFIVETEIKQKQSPTYSASTFLYKDDGLFVDPNSIKDLVHVFANNLLYFDLKEASFDGYVTYDSLEVYANETKTKSGLNIGEQLMVHTTTLKNGNKSMKISWSYNSKTFEYKPIKNCESHSFYSRSSPYPGKTVTSSSDYIVIPLDKIAAFYKRKYTYDEEQKVLFVR